MVLTKNCLQHSVMQFLLSSFTFLGNLYWSSCDFIKALVHWERHRMERSDVTKILIFYVLLHDNLSNFYMREQNVASFQLKFSDDS